MEDDFDTLHGGYDRLRDLGGTKSSVRGCKMKETAAKGASKLTNDPTKGRDCRSIDGLRHKMRGKGCWGGRVGPSIRMREQATDARSVAGRIMLTAPAAPPEQSCIVSPMKNWGLFVKHTTV